MNDIGLSIQVFLVCIGPILIIPILVAAIIFRRSSEDDAFARYAGWLTLKPLLTTPFWWLILVSSTSNSYTPPGTLPAASAAGILPGLLVTIIIASRFQSVLFGAEAKRDAWLLLVLDCARWINSGLMLAFTGRPYAWQASQSFMGQLGSFSSLAGIMLPTIFAIIALGLTRDARKRKPKRDAYFYEEN